MAIRWPKWLGGTELIGETSPKEDTPPYLSHPLASPTYETHTGTIDLEEASKRSDKYKGPKNLSMAWDDSYTGLSSVQTRDGLLSERDKKDTYYKAYIGNPWVRACVQAIAKRFTSGKWEIEEIEQGKGNEQHRDQLNNLLRFVNPDEDFKQLLRSIAEDLGIYGEAFIEIVYGPDGLPAQLHKIDCITMSVKFDQHGMVTSYQQSLDKSNDTVTFEPDQIIRWWFPDPRASKKALSPIECMKDSVFLYQSMITWGEKFFKQGGRPAFSIEMGEDSSIDDAKRYIKFFKEEYLGIQNAHVPPVTYNGAKLQEFGKGSVELDFLKSLSWARDEILAGYNVPLSVTGIQETAHLGGGSGESANKLFIYNVVKPVEELILEKFNYRVVQKAFNILDYRVTVQHADYRDDQEIAKINDMKIRNGSRLIDEVRQEEGGMPYVKGGDVAVIVTSREVTPIERLADLADEQRQTAQLSIEMQKAQVDKAKNPPPPPPVIVGQPGSPNQQQQKPPPAPGKSAPDKQLQLPPTTGKPQEHREDDGYFFVERRHAWRQPSDAQLKAEQELKDALLALVSSAYKRDYVVSDKDKEHAIQGIAHILQRATDIGKTYAQFQLPATKSREALGHHLKDLVGRAGQIVNTFIDHIKEWITGHREDDPETLANAYTDFADNLSEGTAQYEVVSVIEETVFQAGMDAGMKKISWIAMPDACPACQDNADQGEIDIDEAFSSGDMYPPLHPRCRCHLSFVGEEE